MKKVEDLDFYTVVVIFVLFDIGYALLITKIWNWW